MLYISLFPEGEAAPWSRIPLQSRFWTDRAYVEEHARTPDAGFRRQPGPHRVSAHPLKWWELWLSVSRDFTYVAGSRMLIVMVVGFYNFSLSSRLPNVESYDSRFLHFHLSNGLRCTSNKYIIREVHICKRIIV